MKNDLEAVKLLADWSKWLASLQTAVLSLVGFSTVFRNSTSATVVYPWVLVCTIVFFLGSLICASFILFALPGIVQRLPPPDGKDILLMGTYNGGGIKLVKFSVVQFVLFALGAAAGVVWAALQLFSSQ